MAKRIWVKNRRVKGGGYWRRIKGNPSTRSGRSRKHERGIQQGIKNWMQESQSQRTPAARHSIRNRKLNRAATIVGEIENLNEHIVTFRSEGRHELAQGVQSDIAALRSELNSIRSDLGVKSKNRNVGHRPPKTTKTPKSRKPKKTGPYQQGRSDAKGLKPLNASGMSATQRRAYAKGVSDVQAKRKKATKGSVKAASGKKRTLSEAQKSAKRTRAKARRAKRRK